MTTRGLLIAGLAGGSGKSIVAVGLTAALRQRGMTIAPFKKGPDYIDAGWLKLAAGHPCYNLDPYLIPAETLRQHFQCRAAGADLAIIEGNRGLYDGVTATGGYASADLAMLLGLPVIVVVNCTKMTRTVAALVLGCQHFEPSLSIAGVILNQVATSRQEKVIAEAVKTATGIPVLGALPRLERDIFPMRHLGMLPWQEYHGHEEAITELARLVGEHCDLKAIVATSVAVPSVAPSVVPLAAVATVARPEIPLKIGVFHDASFQFYYNENLEALAARGAELLPVNALTDPNLPEGLDGLYIGGGFPETSARQLAANASLRAAVRQAALDGLPIYAECGGLIYLCQSLEVAGETFPMAGVFPVRLAMTGKPQAHGYCHFAVDSANPFYQIGTVVRGHEFRYSRVIDWPGDRRLLALRMIRGKGFTDGRDGLLFGNTLALYTHVHADGVPEWAEGFIARCLQWKRETA
ncbi:MAG: cobyrinate a,c-diamide synthase [Desulfobulbaceae bacterium]|jgi:cobyrinic acid a,c-diamide synthase|nr:cobyrinate a,c-diamide synthase [Desulfobulbaceae bacterium]